MQQGKGLASGVDYLNHKPSDHPLLQSSITLESVSQAFDALRWKLVVTIGENFSRLSKQGMEEEVILERLCKPI
jgi:hypothetical protein